MSTQSTRSIQTEFEEAVKYVRETPASTDLDNETMLKFYGLYKQATEGNIQQVAPSRIWFKARAKHDAWTKYKNIHPKDAAKAYVDLVRVFQK